MEREIVEEIRVKCLRYVRVAASATRDQLSVASSSHCQRPVSDSTRRSKHTRCAGQPDKGACTLRGGADRGLVVAADSLSYSS